MTIALSIAAVALGLYVAYLLIHKMVPSWGTVLTNVGTGLAIFADFINALPWGSVLESKESAFVLFAGSALANVAMRLSGGGKAKVGAGA